MTKKKLKHLVIQNLYRVINPFRTLYWFIFRPKTRGVKVVIFWQGKILLVRISYAHRLWTIPGGGVGRQESFRDAAFRETKEEVGIEANDAEFFYEYHNTSHYKRDTVQCFVAHVSSPKFVIDEQEISEAGWFSPGEIPLDSTSRVKELLLKYSEWEKNHV